MATQTLPEIDLELSEPDEYCHYVRIQGLLEGGVQVALCGKKWIPETIAQAADRPICPKCKDLMDILEMLAQS